jgi:hypothetical protein
MVDFGLLDKCLQRYVEQIKTWSPDRFIHVDIETLKRLSLLDFYCTESQESQLTRYFQIAETQEKITLVNDDFIIWIIPEIVENSPVTFTVIAINENDNPKLELTFKAQGVYNSSKLVMRVLEKLLEEIQENEDLLTRYQKKS